MTASRPLLRIGAITAALSLTGAGVAFAAATSSTPTSTDGATDSAVVASHANHKHGGQDGHLEGSSAGLTLIGQQRVNDDEQGRVADVGVLNGHAYLTAFNDGDCKKGGVYVFDIRKPSAPKQIAFIRGAKETYAGEGAQAISLKTPQYDGDVLLFNNENCQEPGKAKDTSNGGISLVDVSNPKKPVFLADGFGDVDPGETKAHAVHSVFAWQPVPGEEAYAVMVDNEEGEDVDIVDISDPRKPRILAEFDLNKRYPQIIDTVKGGSESFLHDMVVKEIDGRQIMLASYWDGGYVTLDVTDPENPVYLSDSDFAPVDEQLFEKTKTSEVPEGNAHQAEFSKDDQYILAADEDFSPFSLIASTGGEEFDANSGDGTPQIKPGTTLAGPTTFVGRACPGDPTVSAGDPDVVDVAVVERGVCDFSVKVAAVEAAGGWDAVLIVNRTAEDGCEGTLGMSVVGGVPTFGVSPRSLAYDLFPADEDYSVEACESGDGSQLLPIAVDTKGESVSFDSYFDGWGYVRLFANDTDTAPDKLTQLDTYAIDEAFDETKAVGFGDLSVHEIAFSEKDPTLAYISYYSGGTRVVRIENDKIVEKAHHIDADGSNVWGVQVFQHEGKEYVAASDRDYGLQIFEYTAEGGVKTP